MTAWVFTYDGVSFGAGQPIGITDEGVEGLDLPGIRTSDGQRDQAHGVTFGRDLAEDRSLVFHLYAVDAEPNAADRAAAREAVWGALRAVCGPRADAPPLTFQVDGRDAQRVYCRPRVLRQVYDKRLAALGYAAADLMLVAADPLIYSDVEHEAVTARQQPGAGFLVPFTVPFTVPASTSTGTITAANAGNAAAPWTARLDGPLTNPQIRHVEQDRTLTFDANGGLDITAGQWVDVASDGRQVLLNSTSDVRYRLRLPESRWFALDPGTQQIELTANAGTGTMTFRHRDASWS